MTNQTTGHNDDLHAQMRLYDTLPKVVREYMSTAPVALGARTPHGFLYKYDADETVMNMEQLLRRWMIEGPHSTGAIWGHDHPQAAADYKGDYHMRPRRARRMDAATRVVELRRRRAELQAARISGAGY